MNVIVAPRIGMPVTPLSPDTTAASSFVRIDRVSKSFAGIKAVDDVSIDIAKGELFALLGGSGCGKTTLLRMLAGFETPSSGRILIDGKDMTEVPPYERPVNMMFQSYALFPWRTVRKNVEFGPRMKGLSAAECRTIADRFIDMVGLHGFADYYPAELSGGMQQRVTLARSLAADPEVLLMDEPFAALDAMTRHVLQEELTRIQQESLKTIVLVTHNIDEALIMADRIVVMSPHPGQIKAVIPNELPRPRDLDVQLSRAWGELKKEIWLLVAGDVSLHAS